MTSFRNASWESTRWLQLVLGVWGSITEGSVYSFGIFAYPLILTFSMTNTQLNILSTCAFMWGFFNAPAGMLLDRFGPRGVNIVGFTLYVIGFTSFGALFYIGYAKPESSFVQPNDSSHTKASTLVTLTISYAFCAWAASFMDPGLVLPNLTIFPKNQSIVIVIQKTFMGLATSIFALLYATGFGSAQDPLSIAKYLWTVAGVGLVAGFVMVLFVRHSIRSTTDLSPMYKYWQSQTADVRIARVGFVIITVLTVYVIGFTIVINVYEAKHKDLPTALLASLLAVLALMTLSFAILFILAKRLPSTLPSVTLEGSLPTADVSKSNEDDTEDHTDDDTVTVHDEQLTYPIKHSLSTCSFWMIFFLFFVLLGGGSIVSSNSAQIFYATLGSCSDPYSYKNSLRNAVFIILIGIGNSVGRAVGGVFHHFNRSNHPSAFLFVAPTLMTLGFSLLCLGAWINSSSLFYPGFFIQGMGYGVSWSVLALVVVQLYVKHRLGMHYGLLALGALFGIPIFSLGIVVPLYNHASASSSCCIGPHCYGPSLLIIITFCILAIPASVMIHRFNNLY